MSDGIWLEVSRVRIEGTDVKVQLAGDKRDDEPEWWLVEEDALGDAGQKAYSAIATGLDKSDQVVIARLGSPSAPSKNSDSSATTPPSATPSSSLVCTLIRIQTT